jgi:hypothetical protein
MENKNKHIDLQNQRIDKLQADLHESENRLTIQKETLQTLRGNITKGLERERQYELQNNALK